MNTPNSFHYYNLPQRHNWDSFLYKKQYFGTLGPLCKKLKYQNRKRFMVWKFMLRNNIQIGISKKNKCVITKYMLYHPILPW